MLDAAAIIAEAVAATGVADGDPAVARHLARLCAALGETGDLSEAGEALTRRQFVAEQGLRLEARQWLAERPEIAAEVIEAPVFLMGLPRSGTTYLQYLFDRDPRFRQIRTWQSTLPHPPPGLFPETIAPRRAAWIEARKAHPSFAGFAALHLYDEDGPEECHAFLQHSYGAAGLNNLFRVPAYFDWLLDEADLVASYRIHKRMLQLLQHRLEPRRWALKYPNHLLAMEAILAVHPEARFVMTHRDPLPVTASIAKMSWNLRGLRSATPPDPAEVGRDMRHFIRRHIDRILAFDAGPHGARVIHVDYAALVRDPVGGMRRIHDGLGIATPAAVAQAVAAWRAANPQHARGRNDYTLAQWGLDRDDLSALFADYRHRFAIPEEAR
ncbi:MAG: sulfotransferase [Sphingomonadales bacterium]|nr:sulfotransferase [Sphingomonadales bacterium]